MQCFNCNWSGALISLLVMLICTLKTGKSALGQMRFDGNKVLRIHISDQNKLRKLHKITATGRYQVDYWAVPRATPCDVDIHLPGKEVNDFKRDLTRQKLPHSVFINDVQRLIDMERAWIRKERHISDRIRRDASVPHGIVGKYAALSEIRQWQSELVQSLSEVVSLLTIGQSYEGRPLEVLKVGKPGVNKNEVWLDGAMHSREWISPASIIYMLHQLLVGWTRGGALEKQILETLDLYIMIIANPDGYEFSRTSNRLWRKNRRPNPGYKNSSFCDGTDLNRNFPFHWGEARASKRICSNLYRGPRAASEPETKALMKFVQSHARTLTCFISVHSYSQYWLARWAYTEELAQHYNETMALLEDTVKAVEALYGTHYQYGPSNSVLCGLVATVYFTITGTEYKAPACFHFSYTLAGGLTRINCPARKGTYWFRDKYSGGSPDWARGELNVKHSYLVELRDRGHFGFILPANFVQPVGEELWAGMKVILTRIVNESIASERQNGQYDLTTSKDFTSPVSKSHMDQRDSQILKHSSVERGVTKYLSTKGVIYTSHHGTGSRATKGPTLCTSGSSDCQPVSKACVLTSGLFKKLGLTLFYFINRAFVL